MEKCGKGKRFCDWNDQLIFLDCTIYENRIWVIGRTVPGIFSMNFQFSDIKLEYELTELRGYESVPKGLGVRITKSFVYVFMEKTPYVYKINRFTNEHIIIESSQKFMANELYDYGDKVFIVPADTKKPLLTFDGKQFKECADWKEKVSVFKMEGQRYFTLGCTYAKQKEMWTMIPYSNQVLKTDLEDFSVQAMKISGEFHFENIACYERKFYLVSVKPNCIISWEPNTGQRKIYDIFPDDFLWGEKYTFVKMFFYQQMIWLIPGSGSGILGLDTQYGSMRVVKLPDVVWEDDGAGRKFFPAKQIGNQIYLFAYGADCNMVFDMEQEKIIVYPNISIPEQVVRKLGIHYSRNNNIMEDNNMIFDNFVDYFHAVERNAVEKKESNVGKRIYSYFK